VKFSRFKILSDSSKNDKNKGYFFRILYTWDQCLNCEKLTGGWTFRQSELDQNCDVNYTHIYIIELTPST